MAFRDSNRVQEALRGDSVVARGIDFWEMNGIYGLDNMEVVIIYNFDVWITEFASHDHLGVVFIPRGSMPASWVISSVNQVIVITGGFESVRAFKVHGVKQGTQDFFG